MPKYYGCPCEACGKPLTLQDDIVVCPDCGAPYHRACYEALGQCANKVLHRTAYEWKFPYQDSDLRTCPACGERTLRKEENCRCCGAKLPPESAVPPAEPKQTEQQANRFDYSGFYRQYQQVGQNDIDPTRRVFRAAFGNDETMDGISREDWIAYIGSSAPAYLGAYSKMQLTRSKISMSFSALLFGPFYFFYRKAWKPAFAFLAAELVLMVPYLIEMMQITGSSLAPSLSTSALVMLGRICSVLSFVLMVVRGMYGKWFYRKSAAARIHRIEAEFPDAEKRRAVLQAQGGVSLAAVFGAFVLMMVIGSATSLLLGPDVEALLSIMYS